MTPAAKERRSKGEKATLKIPLGNLIMEVAGWRLFWLVLSTVGLLAAIAVEAFGRPTGWLKAVTITGTVVLPLVITILLAPKQKTQDHSKLSADAVEELFELRRSHDSMLEDLDSIDHSNLSFADSKKITKTIQELIREYEQLAYQIGHWGEVSPDVVEHMIEQRSKRQGMLARMEEHARNEGKI
jgi:hypothetical protein